MNVIKLTRLRTGEPIYINFVNVVSYAAVENGTRVKFIGSADDNSVVVTETTDDINRSLGLLS